jgi:hypothetical protein
MAIQTVSKILNRVGNYEDLPTLSTGEIGLAVDVNRLFIGNSGNNLELLTSNSDISNTVKAYTFKNADAGYNIQTGAVTDSFNDIAFSNGIYVAVANNGVIYSSTDGYNWSARTSGVVNNLTTVCVGNVYRIVNGSNVSSVGFVAGGSGGTVLTSVDGLTWMNSTLGVAAGITSIGFGNNLFVATLDNGYVATSVGAQTWQFQTIFNTALTDVTYGANNWLVVGVQGKSAHSNDGQVWTVNNQLVVGSNVLDFNAVSFRVGAFVASASGQMLISTDATNWALTFVDAVHSICYGNGIYLAVGDNGHILSTPDLNSWSTQQIGSYNLRHVIYDGARFIAVGDVGTIQISSDGVNWATKSSDTNVALTGVAFNGSVYVAVGALGTVSYSTDLTLWTATNITISDFESVTAFNNVFYAVGRNGTLYSSNNGVNWTPGNSGVVTNLWAVACNSSNIIAVGDSGTIITSTNGVTWLRGSSNVSIPLFDVCLTGSFYYAVGVGGSVVSSTDLSEWTTSTPVTNVSLIGAGMANNNIFAVGNNNTIVRYNANVWSVIYGSSLSSPMAQYYAIVPYNSGFIATGQNGLVASTNNMVNWQSAATGNLTNLQGIVVNNNQITAIGIDGKYVNSSDGSNWTVQSIQTNTSVTWRSWQQKFDDIVSIKDFGVHSDDSDSGVTINNALSQLYCATQAANARKVLWFPAGKYATSVQIKVPSNAIIRGEGINNTIINSLQPLAQSVFCTADSFQQAGSQAGLNGAALPNNITFEHLTIASPSDGLWINRASDVVLQSVGFDGAVDRPQSELNYYNNSTSGVVLTGVTFAPAERIQISNCEFAGFTTGISAEALLGQANDVTVNNCFFNNLYRGISLAYINGSVNNMKITSNVFDNIYAEGIRADSVTNIISIGNSFKEVGNNLQGVSSPQEYVITFGQLSSGCSSLYDNFIRPANAEVARIESNERNSAWTLDGLMHFGSRQSTIGEVATCMSNASVTLVTFSVATQNHISIDYTINRGVDCRTGTVTVVLNGANIPTVQDSGVQTASVGVTWSAVVLNGIVSITVTTTSASDLATVLYSTRYFATNA